MAKSNQLQVHIKRIFGGKVVSSTTKRKRFTGLAGIRRYFDLPHDKVYIKVTYRPDEYNDGYYTNYADALQAFSSWTEKPLLDWLEIY